MKTSVFKMVVPVLAFLFASASAMGSVNGNSNTTSADIQGWKRVSPFNCQAVKKCNNIGSILCVDGFDQMYAKPSPTSDCSELLTHRP